jgi:glucokinase
MFKPKPTLLFDIGGTNMRLSLSESGRDIGTPIIVRTPADFRRGMIRLRDLKEELIGTRSVRLAVGGVAGALDRKRGRLTQSPLRGWVGKPLLQELPKALGCRVMFENDSALVGLGEAVFGAGKSHDIVAYITVSTGVGGARIVGGRVDANALGFEPGHQIISFDGPACTQCGHRGDLQSFIGGRSLERQYRKKPWEIHDAEVWDRAAHHLAIGLVNVTVFWSPDVIVLGGSMFKNPGVSIPVVRKYLKKELSVFHRTPKITRGTLGDVGGLWGALALARTRKG